MQQPISRRRFFRTTIVGLAVAAVGIHGFRFISQRQHVALITDVLREKLSYLTLDEEGLVEFAHDHLEKLGVTRFEKMAQLARRDNYAMHELATFFLMSSDFFWLKADTTRVVNYRSYYDAYSGCSNPFADLSPL